MKHAYLIMAHNEPYILERLLKLIDDKRNDIYLHIDKKWHDFDFEYFKKIVNKSNLYFTDRLDVRWGTYRQIECELLLFEMAHNNGGYSYYHLLSGIDMPLVNQDVIHDYFDKNNGKEFICFDYHNKALPDTIDRIKYFHLFVNNMRNNNLIIKVIFKIFHKIFLIFQKIFHVNRLKKVPLTIRKGANWVSVTEVVVDYILSKKEMIRKIFSYSVCADEVFLQTIIYNSDLYDKLIGYKNDDNFAIKRYIDWKRGKPYTFKSEDFNDLINSGCFFARKFSIKVDKEIIDKIYDYVKGE